MCVCVCVPVHAFIILNLQNNDNNPKTVEALKTDHTRVSEIDSLHTKIKLLRNEIVIVTIPHR